MSKYEKYLRSLIPTFRSRFGKTIFRASSLLDGLLSQVRIGCDDEYDSVIRCEIMNNFHIYIIKQKDAAIETIGKE